ncbi:heavy metal-binding domain-containing protein [Hymenobacter sp. B1770]|uniref:heavy metal-binding domain-containing protein n=1 Tax=Hymenobacter sp. B1770 TaxID=1718788 RepID=UPI003CF9247D
MRTNLLFLTLSIAATTLLSSCDNKATTTETSTTTATEPQAGSTPTNAGTPASDVATASYTCEMHPEVVSDKPGDCPKCGMTLTKK